MTIFIVVGMPASGKNAARIYAESKGLPYFATGDLVRAEVERQGLNPNAENMAQVSDAMRGDDGMGVTRRALAFALESGGRAVFMEGMRSRPEIQLIQEQAPAVVVAFLAPRSLRRQRVVSRGRSDDSPEAFEERDRREVSYGTTEPVALADEYILNTGTIDDALDVLDAIVRKYVDDNPPK